MVHWLVGNSCMVHISLFVYLLRGVLRNGVLYFIRDPPDLNYNLFRDLIDDLVHKHAYRVLLFVAVHASLIVMLIYLLVECAMRVTHSIVPLDIWVSDPFTEVQAAIFLNFFNICLLVAIQLKLQTKIEPLLHCWFTAVGWALSLIDFFLPRPEDKGGQENGNSEPRRRAIQLGGQDRAMVAVAVVDDPNNDIVASGNSNSSDRYQFVLCIVLLLVIALVTLLVINSALIVVAVYVGRALLNAIIPLFTDGFKCNDLDAFVIESYVL